MTKKTLLRVSLFLSLACVALAIVNLLLLRKIYHHSTQTVEKISNPIKPEEIAKIYPTQRPSPSPGYKASSQEVNNLYGPCVHLPVIFYHHIQNMDIAKAAGQQNLTVSTDIFISQMKYLKSKGYVTLSSNYLTDFFDKGSPVPNKGVMIIFDDGYQDFYTNAFPILKQLELKAIIALPTGLVGNPGYMTWEEISQIASSQIEIANHTWSHASLNSRNTDLIQKEIITADTQLNQKGYNQNKVFIYPYGEESAYAINVLQSNGYKLAFTTNPGSILCKKQRYSLPRVRIGNANLSMYGF